MFSWTCIIGRCQKIGKIKKDSCLSSKISFIWFINTLFHKKLLNLKIFKSNYTMWLIREFPTRSVVQQPKSLNGAFNKEAQRRHKDIKNELRFYFLKKSTSLFKGVLWLLKVYYRQFILDYKQRIPSTNIWQYTRGFIGLYNTAYDRLYKKNIKIDFVGTTLCRMTIDIFSIYLFL